MLLSRRRIRGLFVLGALALVLGAVPARALADGFVTADYSGTWDEAYVYDPSNPAVWQESMHFVWDERLTAHVGGNPTIVTVRSMQLTITGKFTSSWAPPQQARSCSADFSVRKGAPFPMLLTASGSVSNPRLDITSIAPLPGKYAQLGSGGDCFVPLNGGAGTSGSTPTHFFAVTEAPAFSFKLNRRSFTQKFKTFDNNPDGSKQIGVNVIFRAATNGNRPPTLPPLPPLDTPVRDQSKRNAVRGMRAIVVQALYPCGVGAAGITVQPAGLVGKAAGSVMVGIAGPLCVAFVNTLTYENKTYDDPPRSDYFAVARVATGDNVAPRTASCSRFSGSTQAFCLKVAAAAANLLATVRQTAAVAAAIRTTVSRDTAAANAHNQAAVNLQEQALTSLSAQLAAARRIQSSAGAALQAALRSGGVSLRITVAQFKRDAKSLLTALARRGVSAPTLRKLAGAALRPRRLDPIAAF